ncbi:relaxase/mobilization nuclease [Streptomyces sp. NPDC020799]|uniref:relaxase/mobilization nuclease n=1 Tax=Streptomyces sp. NPDC020799 TaxID=3365091 RepID=UPI0037BAED70
MVIARVHRPCRSFTGAFSEAFDGALAPEENLADDIILAHSSGLAADGERPRWTSRDVAEHLAAPARRQAQGPEPEQPLVFHLSVGLHPDDRVLTKAEWSEIAHRFARSTGIAPPGDEQACRWIALRVGPRRVHLVANLIREDGTRARQPYRLPAHLLSESHRIACDLGLRVAGSSADGPQSVREPAVAGAAQATLLRQLAEESNGPLANVRRLVERAAYQVADLPDGQGGDTGRRLEWVARRLYALQKDLHATASSLGQGAQRLSAASPVLVTAPAAPAHRSH